MRIEAHTFDKYLDQLDDVRKDVILRLRQTVLQHIPVGFDEVVVDGFIDYVVPLNRFEAGYHVSGGPLDFMAIASQKNYVAIYFMAFVYQPELRNWFIKAYEQSVGSKVDLGKSCLRLRNMKKIPYELIGELVSNVSLEDFVESYQQSLKR